jgi:hypothetical protein
MEASKAQLQPFCFSLELMLAYTLLALLLDQR